MQISGKRVLITGAAQGLGKTIANHLAEAGAEVIITDLGEDRVRAAIESLRQKHPQTFGYTMDVTSIEGIHKTRELISLERGPVDILVNNAGIVFGGAFLEVPLDHHLRMLQVNTAGVMNVTYGFLPGLIQRPEASIVNVSSASGFVPVPWGTTYAASKSAVTTFSESLRLELQTQGHRHVHILSMCPGYIDTGMFQGAKPPAMTRFLQPDEVARKILRGILRETDFVMIPRSIWMLYSLFGTTPGWFYRWLCRRLGVDTSMKDWQGHSGSKK